MQPATPLQTLFAGSKRAQELSPRRVVLPQFPAALLARCDSPENAVSTSRGRPADLDRCTAQPIRDDAERVIDCVADKLLSVSGGLLPTRVVPPPLTIQSELSVSDGATDISGWLWQTVQGGCATSKPYAAMFTPGRVRSSTMYRR